VFAKDELDYTCDICPIAILDPTKFKFARCGLHYTAANVLKRVRAAKEYLLTVDPELIMEIAL